MQFEGVAVMVVVTGIAVVSTWQSNVQQLTTMTTHLWGTVYLLIFNHPALPSQGGPFYFYFIISLAISSYKCALKGNLKK